MAPYNSPQPLHSHRAHGASPQVDIFSLNEAPRPPSTGVLQSPNRSLLFHPQSPIPSQADLVAAKKIEASQTKLHKESQPNLSRLAGDLWRRMGDDEKQPFIHRAELAKEEHTRDYPDYSYRPTKSSNRLQPLSSSATQVFERSSVSADGRGFIPSSKPKPSGRGSGASGNPKAKARGRATILKAKNGSDIPMPSTTPLPSSPSTTLKLELLDDARNLPPTKRRIHNRNVVALPVRVKDLGEVVPTLGVSMESLEHSAKRKTPEPEPMSGVEDNSLDPISRPCRPFVPISFIFPPALSPGVAQSNEVSCEQSIVDAHSVTPETVEPPVEEEETPLVMRFKISSLMDLMDKNFSVSPPHSPAPTSSRSLTQASSDEPPVATLSAAMQDIFVLKTHKLNPETKVKFLVHLQEEFGIQVAEQRGGQGARDDNPPWASLPESIIKQFMAEGAPTGVNGGEDDDEEGALMAVDLSGGEFGELMDEFTQDSAGQLKVDMKSQLQEMVSQLSDELVAPLQDALTLHLKNEIIVQVSDQMMEALVVQGEEAELEFEWRHRFLEQQIPVDAVDTRDEVIQHPLHHLFLHNEAHPQ